jgi:hypothetical protein
MSMADALAQRVTSHATAFAIVVSSCGAQSFTASVQSPLTMLENGELCTNATGGGGGGTSSTFGSTFPTTGTAIGGEYSGNMEPFQLDSSGYLYVDVPGAWAAGTNIGGGAQATAIAIEKAGLTKAWVIEKTRENALVALGEKKIKLTVLPKGQATTIDVEVTAHNPQAATRALELLGREVNAFVEKKEVGGPGDFDAMSAEELLEIILRETAELNKGMH